MPKLQVLMTLVPGQDGTLLPGVILYPGSSLMTRFPDWERHSETTWRTSNSSFTIQIILDASKPACVSLMRFWKRSPVS